MSILILQLIGLNCLHQIIMLLILIVYCKTYTKRNQKIYWEIKKKKKKKMEFLTVLKMGEPSNIYSNLNDQQQLRLNKIDD